MAKRVNLNTVLDMLRVNDFASQSEEDMRIGSAFVSLWPKEASTLNNFREKPRCGGCKGAMVELLAAEPGRVKAFLKRVSPGEEFTVDVASDIPHGTPRARDPMGPKSVVGEVHDLDDSPEAYGKFIQEIRLRGGRYNGLAVRPLELGKVRVYFY
jgi:hypothetical protein